MISLFPHLHTPFPISPSLISLMVYVDDKHHVYLLTSPPGRCDGSCSRTCTFDGRKYASIGGVTASLSLVLLDNVMCTASDPYHHHDNILVHEFAHTVDKYGLTSAEKQQVRFVATDMFVATKGLSRQAFFCRDTCFVAINMCLSRQK